MLYLNHFLCCILVRVSSISVFHLDMPYIIKYEGFLFLNVFLLVSFFDSKVEKEKIHDHERQCSYEHLNLLLHFIMGIKVSLESLQPQSLEVASQKLQELHQSLRDLELKMSQFGGVGAAPVQGACAPPTLATSFTPLPSAVGAALELQLQSEKTKVAELSRRCQELELKVSTFENIVCVLNREMERSCTTMEAYNRQHRLDQDKIEILNNKVTDSTFKNFNGIYTTKVFLLCNEILTSQGLFKLS